MWNVGLRAQTFEPSDFILIPTTAVKVEKPKAVEPVQSWQSMKAIAEVLVDIYNGNGVTS